MREVDDLVATLRDLSKANQDRRPETLPYAMLRGEDVLDSIRARVERPGLTITLHPGALMIGCNAYELVGVLTLTVREHRHPDRPHRSWTCGWMRNSAGHPCGSSGPAARSRWRRIGTAAGPARSMPFPRRQGAASCRTCHRYLARGPWMGGLEAVCLPILQARRSVKRPDPMWRGA
jgi:DNA polymerase III subunit epsilon